MQLSLYATWMFNNEMIFLQVKICKPTVTVFVMFKHEVVANKEKPLIACQAVSEALGVVGPVLW